MISFYHLFYTELIRKYRHYSLIDGRKSGYYNYSMYTIGSFNMHNLGFNVAFRSDGRNLKKIDEIIHDEQFDIVALQEVLNEGRAFTYQTPEGFKKSILHELGESNYDFIWADSQSDENNNRAEGYAFLWNKRRLRLVETETDRGIRLSEPTMLAKTKGIIRAPFYGRFTPQGLPGGTNFELRLICIHNYYGSRNSEDIYKRRNELDVLLKEVYPRWSKKVYKNDIPHYTVLLGDYNLELARPNRRSYNILTDENDIVVSEKYDNMKIQTVQEDLTSLKRDKSDDGTFYVSNFDHFSFDYDEFKKLKKVWKRVDCVQKYYNGDNEKYFDEISDHIPVMMKIELK